MRKDYLQGVIMVLERFNELVKKLTSTLGRLEKESYLAEIKDDADVLEILKFLFNPYIVTGISDKKLAKQAKQKEKEKELPLFALTSPVADAAPPYFKGELSTSGCDVFLEVLEYFKANNTGKDKDVKLLVEFAEDSGFAELVYSIVKRDLKLGVQGTTLNKVFGSGFVPMFDVMLAESYAENMAYVEGKDFIITEKLDGIRCVCMFGESGNVSFFSRSGQVILDLVEIAEQVMELPKGFVYDGELLLGNPKGLSSEDLYRATVKVTNADAEKRGLYFNVFDMVTDEGFKSGIDERPAIERKNLLITILGDKHKNIKPVPMLYKGNDIGEIQRFLKKYSENGGEGIMLNVAGAPYECKRSKGLLKVKQFNTADVFVVDVEEGTGANKGKLGAVHVKFIVDGKEYTCKVGSGFKLEEREKFWADKDLILGKIIEIGYFELSRNQKDDEYSLRFPTFKHLRLDKTDISMH